MAKSIARVKDGVNYTLGTMPAGMRWKRGTVLERVANPHGQSKAYYRLLCDCGKTYIACGVDLNNGKIKSCGCYHIDAITKHGDCVPGSEYERLHHCWKDMIRRCYNKNSPKHYNHGGRGITVCNEWRTYPPFKEWALASGYEKHLTIDRYPNNDGNYEPSNCRWATAKQQARNTRLNHFITACGETKLMVDWAKDSRCVVCESTLYYRIVKLGWSHERAITEPSH